MTNNFLFRKSNFSLITTLLITICSVFNVNSQQVCMVTADFQTGDDYIVKWEAIDDITNIDSVYIYRKQGIQTLFYQVGSVNVDASSPTFFTDVNATTYDTTKYAIAYLMNDGTVTPRSLWHQAVVMDYAGSGEFTWTKYRTENQIDESYISGYEVLKDNLNLGTFLGLGGLLNSVLNFVDLTYLLTPNARYVVEVTLPTCNVVEKANIHTSRSNIKQQRMNPAPPSDTTSSHEPIIENVAKVFELVGSDYSIYPNPVTSNLKIQFNKDIDVSSTWITDVKGKVQFETNNTQGNSLVISTVNYANGVYFIHIESKGVVTSKRFIVSQ